MDGVSERQTGQMVASNAKREKYMMTLNAELGTNNDSEC